MLHKSLLGSALAVGVALLLSACGQQTPPPPNLPPAGEIGQRPIIADGSSTSTETSESSTSDSDATPPPRASTSPARASEQPHSVPSAEIYAATYVDATNRTLVQRPSEFIPPSVTGEYASEVKLMNLNWSRWDEQSGIAYGSAYVTGGGGAPETVQGVQLILDNEQLRNGTMQYTHYMIVWPQYEPDEGQLNTL
ncbi:hypothetical protein MOQ72_39965 [Saccharopolyspora sp. K220]|uniref:hypothetical protein n=1 Tax=Saccharopolyspora soli TaxID=2926618 RepID=UPI001F5A691E|nr:hypothetical protein [Saccharopolyspora soli]MCI2423600.1 hypothetical protein [Saccharopolyspora soli]